MTRHLPGNRARFVLPAVALGALLVGGCVPRGERDTPTMVTAATPTNPPLLTIVTPTPGPAGTPPPEPASTEQAPAQQPTPEQPGGQPGSYVVQPGDTLYEISVKLGVDVDTLVEANGLSDPSSIYAGQILRIPSGSGQ